MKCQTILNVLKMHSRYVVIRPPLDPITTAAAHLLHAFRGVIWNWPVYKLNFIDPLGVHTATLLAEKTMVIDRSGLGPAWSLLGTTSWLLYGIVFAVSVVIIVKSPVTGNINRTGKLFLILSVASYIASFYIKI